MQVKVYTSVSPNLLPSRAADKFSICLPPMWKSLTSSCTSQLTKSSTMAARRSKFTHAGNYAKALMTPPDHFTVEYAINPWMGGTVDQAKAMKQFNSLKDALTTAGVDVEILPQVKGLPDMVFVCNSGIAAPNKQVYLSHFRHPERQGERTHFREWYEKNGYTVIGEEKDGHFEGGGDAVFVKPDLLLAGYGYRTSKEVYAKIAAIGSFTTILCELVNDRFYHLDTCLCPLDDKRALYYPKAFKQETIDELKKHLELIEVSEEQANHFVCNAIPANNTIIFPSGCEETMRKVEKYGYATTSVEMSEFMKSGGACQCLVLKLPD